MNFRPALLAAILAPALFANSAHAVTTSSGSVTNFRIQLIDLAPDDGIAPSLTHRPMYQRSKIDVGGENESRSLEFNHYENPYSSWQDMTFDRVLVDNKVTPASMLTASSRITGNSFDTLAVSSSTSVYEPHGTAQIVNVTSKTDTFTLSPNTAITITFDLSANVAFSSRGDIGLAESQQRVSVYGGQLSDWNYEYNHDFLIRKNLTATHPGDLRNAAASETFTAYVRSRDEAADVHLFVESSSYIRNTISPVPEPETYAMMLAGLGLLGWTARAKARRG